MRGVAPVDERLEALSQSGFISPELPGGVLDELVEDGSVAGDQARVEESCRGRQRLVCLVDALVGGFEQWLEVQLAVPDGVPEGRGYLGLFELSGVDHEELDLTQGRELAAGVGAER